MIIRTDHNRGLEEFDGKWRRIFVWGPMRTYDGHWVLFDTVWRRWSDSDWIYRVDLPKSAVVAEGDDDEWGDMR